MNTAEVIQFPTAGEQEQRVADTDDGYTRLANELYDELIGANLTRNQAKVAHAVCRKTYGFNKKMDRIADSQLAELTRLPRQKVNKAKNELISMGVLIRMGNQIGPNKTLTEWRIPECHQDSDFVTKTVTKLVTKTVTGVSPAQGHTKDTITKDKKEKNFTSRNSDEFQDDPTENFLLKHPEAAGGIYTPSGKAWGTAEDLKTAQFIFGRVMKINPTAAKPNWPAWANDIRLMREIDGRTLAEICSLYDWASRHHFWSDKILSTVNLRKHWDTLTVQRAKQPSSEQARPGKPPLDWYNRDWADSLPPGTL